MLCEGQGTDKFSSFPSHSVMDTQALLLLTMLILIPNELVKNHLLMIKTCFSKIFSVCKFAICLIFRACFYLFDQV